MPSRRYVQINNYVPVLRVFFCEADLKPAFRLSRETINLLVQMLPRQKPHGWSHEIEVAVCLYWLACGTSYRVTADIFAIPRATVGRIVHSIVDDMMAIVHKVIHFPKPEEMEEVGAGFARLAGHEAFRCAAGAIDGCHVRILPPDWQHRVSPRCPCPPEISNVQGVPISTSWLLSSWRWGVPMSAASSHPHDAIPPAFGMLKTRWRAIFLRALEIRPLFAPKVIAACCILHNLCLSTDDILEEEEEELHDEDEDRGNVPDEDREFSGNNLRARLAAQVSAPGELPACLREHDYD